jgi:hypothetical protein
MVAKRTAFAVSIEQKRGNFEDINIDEGIVSPCMLRRESGLICLKRRIFSRIFSTRSHTFD